MDDLRETLRVIRVFASCMWRRSDPKRPRRQASAGMCCSTSQLVTALLNRREPGWTTVSGYYTPSPNNNGWHCWSQHKDGRIVDLTADQFGDRKIIITNDRDSRYNRRSEWNESNEWLPYYDIWIIPRQKRRLSISQIQQIVARSGTIW